jgi:myosin heavy subunit
MTHNFVWIPNKEYEWILAEILEVDGDNYHVSLTEDAKQAALGKIPSQSVEGSLYGEEILNGKSSFSAASLVSTVNSSDPIIIHKSKTCEFDAVHLNNVDNLSALNKGHMHEGPILHVLRRRFLNDQIYTNAGDLLISINPYKTIPNLYDNPLDYFHSLDKTFKEVHDKPHIYVVADTALRKLSLDRQGFVKQLKNQCVIISGESGAGKLYLATV